MSEYTEIPISAAVEGPVDEAVVYKLINYIGGQTGKVFVTHGKPNLRKRILAYVNASYYNPWFILVDLDTDFSCPYELLEKWSIPSTDLLCFRIAVCEVESWLMSDYDRFASFLGVSKTNLSRNPDGLTEVKRNIVNLARYSNYRKIREGYVPREGSGRHVGPNYTSLMLDFIHNKWRPNVAMNVSESLYRAIQCLQKLVVKTSYL